MEKMLATVVEAIQDKKGKNIVSLDMTGIEGAICSYFVVCHAASTTQVEAISNGIEEMMEQKLGEKLYRVEGRQTGLWVAMDYVDIVVHIFQTELRDFYRLEALWSDAPQTKFESEE
ncbi:MAG: ribosome silencing factor [Rikenellaceae bacterium]